MGYWRHEIRLYKDVWRRTWPGGALAKGANFAGPFALTVLVTGMGQGIGSALDWVLSGLYGLIVSFGWNVFRFWGHLIAAPARIAEESQQELERARAELSTLRASSSLRLNFDQWDPAGRYVVDSKNEHGDKARRFYVGVENVGGRSIERVQLRALPGDLAAETVYVAYDPNESHDRRQPLRMKEMDELHPGEERVVELFGLAHGAEPFNAFNGDVLVIEVTGRDMRAERLSLKFQNGAPPTLARIS